jgi:hypothetical protein
MKIEIRTQRPANLHDELIEAIEAMAIVQGSFDHHKRLARVLDPEARVRRPIRFGPGAGSSGAGLNRRKPNNADL